MSSVAAKLLRRIPEHQHRNTKLTVKIRDAAQATLPLELKVRGDGPVGRQPLARDLHDAAFG
jgi:hypothetical protein